MLNINFNLFRSDAHNSGYCHTDNNSIDINTINLDKVSRIEEELVAYDLVSLVFLLYDDPEIALQRLTVFQRVSNDLGETALNLLQEWAALAQTTRPTWKHELLEALAICQLYKTIRKLGFKVDTVKKHYVPDNILIKVYINPIKKALYKLCENITAKNIQKMQNTLKTYDIDTTDYQYCEQVMLDLIRKEFICIDNHNGERKYELEKLAKIIDNLVGLKKIASELREVQSRLNNEPNLNPYVSATTSISTDDIVEKPEETPKEKYTASAFEDLFEYVIRTTAEESTKALKSDKSQLNSGAYAIKNPARVGVCYIINQVDFHPSKASIEKKLSSAPIALETRLGSDKDKIVLERTMTELNFEVISHRNIDHKKMIELIKSIIQYRIHPDDSIFMLCILSHGVKGHVYAADSVLVKIEDIQNLLDAGFQERHLYEIPKIMILQACQVNNDEPQTSLIADSPSHYYMRKSHFLIYWATAPELEAYRNEKEGTIFIQLLCFLISRCANKEHLYDIFTKVTDGVAKICTSLKKDQTPIFESTLRKKLYLQIPE